MIKEYTQVIKVNEEGNLSLANGTTQTFDKIVNIADPWAEQLQKQSNIKPEFNLDLVRGSHIVIEQKIKSRLLPGNP